MAAAACLFAGCKDDDPSISISPETLAFDGSASSKTITLKANSAWTATNTTDWISVSPKSGSSDGTITVAVSQNNGLSRSGNITFSIGSLSSILTVTQTGYPALTVSESAILFTKKAASKEITLSSNYDWTAASSSDWVTVTPASGSASASAQTVTIAATDDASYARTAEITFSNGSISTKVTVAQEGALLEYGGVTYHTVDMKDGRTWLAEPLSFVPDGKKASSDPGDASGFWYPYSTSGAALTDASSIARNGYLYDYATALGVSEVTKDNYTTFEGARGICPEGYHIPTRAEFIALCGVSLKSSTESANVVNADAAYYNADYAGAKITALDADGFNWNFSGMINRTTSTASGKYMTLATSSTTCSVESYLNRLAMTFLMSSTGYAVNATSGNIQFFGMMSSFTKTTMEGKLTVAYANYLAGYPVRCIKDK